MSGKWQYLRELMHSVKALFQQTSRSCLYTETLPNACQSNWKLMRVLWTTVKNDICLRCTLFLGTILFMFIAINGISAVPTRARSWFLIVYIWRRLHNNNITCISIPPVRSLSAAETHTLEPQLREQLRVQAQALTSSLLYVLCASRKHASYPSAIILDIAKFTNPSFQ